MSKKWDTNQFRDYINDNHSDFELRSEYFGNNKKEQFTQHFLNKTKAIFS